MNIMKETLTQLIQRAEKLKEEAERFVASKENCGDFYEIIEVK